jgi:hypothetical protein
MTHPEAVGRRGPSPLAVSAFLAWAGVPMVFAALVGIRHDYASYVGQWQLVLDGANPWSTDNAYGPLHNALAPLMRLGPLGPKFFMATLFILANAVFLRALSKGATTKDYAIYLICIAGNSYTLIMVFGYSLNDSLVASLVLLAIVARHRGRLLLAGVLVGAAVTLKYYPLFLLPFLALDGRRFHWRIFAGAAGAIAAVFLLGLLLWGGDMLAPLRFGVVRPPTQLSIFAFLRNHSAWVGGAEVVALLVRWNVVVIFAVWGSFVVLAWTWRMNWLEAMVIGFLLVLLSYKVGHTQFFLSWVCMVAALPLMQTNSARRLAWLAVPMALFLAVFQVAYIGLKFGHMDIYLALNREVGAFAFALGVATVATHLVLSRREAAGYAKAAASAALASRNA